MILNRDELMSTIEKLSGDNADDETMESIKNVIETFDDLTTKISDSNIDEINAKHAEEIAELDAMWRKKYKDAYFHGVDEEETKTEETKTEETEEPLTYDDLFEVEKDGE